MNEHATRAGAKRQNESLAERRGNAGRAGATALRQAGRFLRFRQSRHAKVALGESIRQSHTRWAAKKRAGIGDMKASRMGDGLWLSAKIGNSKAKIPSR